MCSAPIHPGYPDLAHESVVVNSSDKDSFLKQKPVAKKQIAECKKCSTAHNGCLIQTKGSEKELTHRWIMLDLPCIKFMQFSSWVSRGPFPNRPLNQLAHFPCLAALRKVVKCLAVDPELGEIGCFSSLEYNKDPILRPSSQKKSTPDP